MLIAACSDSNGPVQTSGAVDVAVAPATISVAPGGTGTSAVTISRTAPFAGAVTLSASGAPSGVTVSFAPSPVATGATTSTVSVAVGTAVAAGSYPITISASGSGVTTASATLTVVVVAGSAGSFALSANPTSLTAAAGAAAVTSAITITRTAPFTAAVALAVTGAPAGVTASVAPTSATGTTATLSVSSTAGAVNGSYPLVVRGTAAGVADASITVNVTVTGGSAQGISLALNPTAVTAAAGGASTTSTVTITRLGGFTGGVNLALSGAPAGLTATVSPNSNVAGTTATITVQAGAGTAAGAYNLTLTGSGTGISNATATLPVTVTAGSSNSVSVTFCTADAPVWVAAQDGNGAWTRVSPTSGSTYSFSFPSGRGGVATVDTVGVGYELNVVYASTAEFTNYAGVVSTIGGCQSKTLNGSVANVGAAEYARVNVGYSSASVFPAGGTTFQLTNVSEGPQDLVATRVDLGTSRVNRIILRRALNIANNGTIPVLDFGAAEAFAPASANATVTGIGGGETAALTSLYTGIRGSTFGVLGSNQATGAAQPYDAVPTAQLAANEFEELVASSSTASFDASRSAGLYFRTVADRTLALGPALSTPTVSKVVTGPNARPRMQLGSQAQYNRLANADWRQDPINRQASVSVTAGYNGGTAPATWDMSVPDLSAAAGWTTTWGLQDGTPISWTASAFGGTVAFFDASFTDGATTYNASLNSATPLSLQGVRSGDTFSLREQLLNTLRQNPLR